MSKVPTKKNLINLCMAAKLGRDFTIVFWWWHEVTLYYGDIVLANTAYKVRNVLSNKIHQNELLWEWWSKSLRKNDERYRKKVYERTVKNRPSSFYEDTETWIPSTYKILKESSFNSDVFWHERQPHYDVEQLITKEDAITYWEKREQELETI